MRRYGIIILLCSFTAGSFAGNPVKRLLTGADTLLQKIYNMVDYDTTYISRSPGKIGLKAWGNVSGASFKAYGSDTRARLRTDLKGTVSLEFDYYDLSLEVAMNPSSLSGRNNDYEINFSFYPRRFVFDVSYQRAKSAAGNITYHRIGTEVEKGWLNTKMLYIDAYYTFNYRQFSYDTPFCQLYIQKQSAGSWLAGISYQGGSISTTYDVPDYVPDSHFHAQHLGIGGGYAYNLVGSKRWLFHLSLIPNLIVWSNNNIETNGVKVYSSTKFPTVLMNGRFGVVHYFNPRHFMGLYGVGNSLLKRKSDTQLVESKWILRMFYGMRI